MKVVADKRYSDTNDENPDAMFKIVDGNKVIHENLNFTQLKDHLNLEIRSHFEKVTGKQSKSFNLREILNYLKSHNGENWAVNSLVFVNQAIGKPIGSLVKRS